MSRYVLLYFQFSIGYVLEMAGRSLVIANVTADLSGEYECKVKLRRKTKDCCGCKQDDE